jgi:cytochrome c6
MPCSLPLNVLLVVALLCGISSTSAAANSSPALAFSFPAGGQRTTKHQQVSQSTAAAAAVVALTLLTTATPAMAAGGNVGRGEAIFVSNCASCHMGGQNFINDQRTLKQDALVKYGVGVDQPSLLNFVTQQSARHKTMVFFRAEGGKLTPEQWEDVTEFVSDQATGNKWELAT